MRRAGLDYREYASVKSHAGWLAFLEQIGGSAHLRFQPACHVVYTDVFYEAGDVLLFGKESTGLPKSILESDAITTAVRIPIAPRGRSLNLANAAAVGVYEAWRQRWVSRCRRTPVTHRATIKVRFYELDPYGHVNHSVYIQYFEAARAEWLD